MSTETVTENIVEQTLTEDLIEELTEEPTEQVEQNPISVITEQVDVPPLEPLSNQTNVSLQETNNQFINSFSAGTMLVRSVDAREIKTINLNDTIVLRNPISLKAFSVRDARVVPKRKSIGGLR